ncbi:MAG: TolC family protein [Bacteroidales bacterium]
MNKRFFIFLMWQGILMVQFIPSRLDAQKREKNLTLQEVIALAREQSPQALLARHRFRASYWQYRTHLASLLPTVTLTGTMPDLNRSIEKITLPDGTDQFVERKLVNTLGSLSLSQNIFYTGGSIFINSDLQRIDQLGANAGHSYLSTPVSIGFRQPLFSYNALRWSRKIEPLKYEEAKRTFVSSMEQVSSQAVDLFFDLAAAQINLDIARTNFSNTDTLYKIALGRYNIGTIAENELLQMELSHLNAGTELNKALIDLEFKKSRLRSFLGFNENVDLTLVIPSEIPSIELDYNKTLQEALQNNPDILRMERQLIEAQRDVAQAKGERGFNATLFASLGFTQKADELAAVYQDPQSQQRVRIGVQIPLLDWGQGKGKVKMAMSSQEVIRTQVQQDQTDFQQNIFLQVMQFNLQDDQFMIAAKADTIAASRYEVTKQRFLIGKISVLDLNVALSEKDQARRAYIESMRNFWTYLYNIRRLTLYDFIENKALSADLEDVL